MTQPPEGLPDPASEPRRRPTPGPRPAPWPTSPGGPGGPPLPPTAVGVAEPPPRPPLPPDAERRWRTAGWLLVPAAALAATVGGLLLAVPVELVLPALVESLGDGRAPSDMLAELTQAGQWPMVIGPPLAAVLLFLARGRAAPVVLTLGAALLGVVRLLGDVDSLGALHLHRVLDGIGMAGVLAGGLGTALLATGVARRAATAAWVAGLGAGVGVGMSVVDSIDSDPAESAAALSGPAWLTWLALAFSVVATVVALVAAPRVRYDYRPRPVWRAGVPLTAAIALVVVALVAEVGFDQIGSTGEWLTAAIVLPGLGLAGLAAATLAAGRRTPAGQVATVAAGLAAATGLGLAAQLGHTAFLPDVTAADGIPSTTGPLVALVVAAVVAVGLCVGLGRWPLGVGGAGLILQLVGLILVLTSSTQSGSRVLLVGGAAVLVVSTTLLVAPWLSGLSSGLAAGTGALVLLGWVSIARLPALLTGYQYADVTGGGGAIDPEAVVRAGADGQRIGMFVLAGLFVVGAGVWCWLARRAADRRSPDQELLVD